MGAQYRLGSKSILLTAFLGFAGMAFAACTGPPTLETKLHANPTSDNAIVLGSWFASRQQFACAVDIFRAAIKTYPQSAQLRYLVGLALLGGGRPAEALPDLKESIRLDPRVIEQRLVLASVYDQTGQPAEAEELWKQALDIDPKSAPALEGLSRDFLARQDFVDVVELLQSVPRTEKLNIALAQALGKLDDLDEAKAVLKEALRTSPASIPLAAAMAGVLIKQVRYQEAIDLLEHTVRLNPGNQEAELRLFRVLVLSNHTDLARPLGPKLLAKRPHDPEVLYLNGVVDRSVGDYAEAKVLLERAVAIDPNFFNSRYNLGLVLVFLHEWKGAKENLEKAIALGAPQPQAHFELAQALRGLGETDRALEEMTQYQKLKKEEEARMEAAESSAQGDAELTAGRIQEAIAHYREAAEGEPANASYKYALSIALSKDGDLEGERAQLEEAVKIDPDLAGAQNDLGFLLSRRGDTAGAIAHFRLAVHAAPAFAEAWVNLAAELAEDSQFAEAKVAVETALKLRPDNAQAQKLSDQLARDPAARQTHP